ncbi:ABC transporter permease [Photobacterium sp. DNB23_23_1]
MKKLIANRIDGRVRFLSCLILIFFILFSILNPKLFLSLQNMESMLLQSTIVGILSLAVALTMITGGIDISINAIANLSAICSATVMVIFQPIYGTFIAVFIGVTVAFIVGVLCGCLNSLVITQTKCPPMLVTLGSGMFFTGIGMLITKGNTLIGLSELNDFGRSSVIFLPVPTIVFFAVGVLLYLMLNKYKFGRHIYLYGENEKAALFSGVETNRVLFKTYICSAFLASIAGVLTLAISNSINVDYGNSYVLLAVLISVLGGIAPDGGKGNIIGVIIAVLLLQILSTGLNSIYQSGSSNFIKEFAWGLSLLLVLFWSKPKSIGGVRVLSSK